MRVADIRMPCYAAQIFADRPSAPLQYTKPTMPMRIAGDEEERSRVREDRHRAENLERGRTIPAFTKKKEVTPKAPGRGLGSDKERGRRFQIQSTTKKSRDSWISRKKCDVRYFHHFVIDRRDSRSVTAVHDVHKPITVMLNESGVSIRERAFRSEQPNRDNDLRQGQNQPSQQ